MKDYSMKYEDAKLFVLNYTIKDNQIIAKLATGEDYVIPYTKGNEMKLLEKMENQVIGSNKFLERQKKKLSVAWKLLLSDTALIVVLSVINPIAAPILNNILFGCLGISFGINAYNMISSKIKIKDIEKNKIFLNNEEKLNEKVRKTQNVLLNTNKKTKEMVNSIPTDKPVFTINSIDKIKFEELNEMFKNIEREEEFGFDYSNDSTSKSAVLNKSKKLGK